MPEVYEELDLELKDEEWPFEYTDHDRLIARAVLFDGEGRFWFVRARRDDDFGKATLIETSGGGVEKGETPETAVLRELREELGAEAEIVCRIGTVRDCYNLIHRHNINNYFLCRALSFGESALTKDEKEDFHLAPLRLSYEEAEAEYMERAETPIGRLIAKRELPVLRRAKEILDGAGRIRINGRISYIEAGEVPLSADIGIIEDGEKIWLFDVGEGERRIRSLTGRYSIVLSHFHRDHIGNLEKLDADELFVSKETYRHVKAGTVVTEAVSFGDIRIFPLPSSHAKGCLGLEVGEGYAFVGDALYGKEKDGILIYNAQLLKELIDTLSALRAPRLLESHRKGFVRSKEDALKELKEIYGMRVKNDPEIRIPLN